MTADHPKPVEGLTKKEMNEACERLSEQNLQSRAAELRRLWWFHNRPNR